MLLENKARKAIGFVSVLACIEGHSNYDGLAKLAGNRQIYLRSNRYASSWFQI